MLRRSSDKPIQHESLSGWALNPLGLNAGLLARIEPGRAGSAHASEGVHFQLNASGSSDPDLFQNKGWLFVSGGFVDPDE